MSKPFYKDITKLYEVFVEGVPPCEVEPELYDKDAEPLDFLAPAYINRLGTENGVRVIYWESDYNPSAYKMTELDDPRASEIFDVLDEYGIEFNEELKEE